MENDHWAYPKEDRLTLGLHWGVSSHLAFWTTGASLFPGMFLLMTLVQIVHGIFHKIHLLLLSVFNLIAWLSPSHPNQGPRGCPGCLFSPSAAVDPTSVVVLKLPLLAGLGHSIVQKHRVLTRLLSINLVLKNFS